MSKTVVYISNIVPLKNKELFKKFYNIMPDYRREKIDRYSFGKDKLLSLGVGVLLKKACKDFGIEDCDNSVVYNEYDKPSFVDANAFFSLSHTENAVMCAVSDAQVGCDIERVREVNPNVSAKVFTEKEKTDFNTFDKEGFFKLWTLKESFLKKSGKGLFLNPLSVELSNGKEIKIAGDNTRFYLGKTDGCFYACAYQTEEIQIKFTDIEKI